MDKGDKSTATVRVTAIATDCRVLGEVLEGGGWAEFGFLDASNQYRVLVIVNKLTWRIATYIDR